MHWLKDTFGEARRKCPIHKGHFQGEEVPMILRHKDVRSAARNWKTFSSDAPFRVPIPSEENVRTIRQLPIETDPPQHQEYRSIIEPFFARAKNPDVIQKVGNTIEVQIKESIVSGREIEIVREFALPVQSKALTYLLNVPESEADTWISWGIHVFRDGDAGEVKGAALEKYLNRKFDEAEDTPGDDFFSALTKAQIANRPLTRDEMLGYANLTFAGGRDTIIHTISSIIGYFGEHPEALAWLREDPARITHASEEFFRVITPLTHIGRVCPVDTDLHGYQAKKDQRVSLCWASANMDESVFDAPQEVRLDRKPNPHVTFGFGPHLCIGAPHARLIVRSLLQSLVQHVQTIRILKSCPRVEQEETYTRTSAYDSLHVQII